MIDTVITISVISTPYNKRTGKSDIARALKFGRAVEITEEAIRLHNVKTQAIANLKKQIAVDLLENDMLWGCQISHLEYDERKQVRKQGSDEIQ